MNILIDYAKSFIGTPYRWGGTSPILGWDCGEFMQEILRSVGLLPAKGDFTSQSLYDYLAARPHQVCGLLDGRPGVVVFYGKSVKEITHVAMQIDAYRVIEAGGGGRFTRTAADADAQRAYVRIRHTSYRKDVVAKIRPDYSTIGCV